jgi:hypothetical protein
MHVTARLFLLRMVDKVGHIALQRTITPGRVGREPPARFDGDIGHFLHRLHGTITRPLYDDRPWTADPGNDGGPICIVVAAAGLALRAPASRAAAQRLLAAPVRLPLVTGGVREVIGFHRPCQRALPLIGHGGMAQPPTPARARADMAPQLFGNATRGTRQPQQKSGEHPVHHRALAAVQERPREVIAGALAVLLFTAGAFESRLVVIRAPGTDVVALTSGALQGPIFPASRMDVRLTRVGVKELVEMRKTAHDCVSPLSTDSPLNRIGDSQLTIES